MTAEESAALMTRAVKLGITITDILFETAEERREDLFLILQRKRIDLTTVKLGVIGFAVNDAVSTTDERRINLTAFVQDDDGNAKGGRLNSLKLAGLRLFGRFLVGWSDKVSIRRGDRRIVIFFGTLLGWVWNARCDDAALRASRRTFIYQVHGRRSQRHETDAAGQHHPSACVDALGDMP